jgi:hypothetical protein
VAARHDEVGRDDRGQERPLEPGRLQAHPVALNEPGASGAALLQVPAPDPVHRQPALAPGGRQVPGRPQHQEPVRLQPFHGEPAVCLRGPVGDLVADLQLLVLGEEVVGAGAVGREQEPVDPAVGVPARPPPAHLDQPGPHGMGRCRDRDRVGGQRRGVGQQVVTGQRLSALLAGGAPGLPEPVQGGVAAHRRDGGHNSSAHGVSFFRQAAASSVSATIHMLPAQNLLDRRRRTPPGRPTVLEEPGLGPHAARLGQWEAELGGDLR